MPSYRFCRPDDAPKLVRAIDACWRPHFPSEAAMTADRFRREMKWLDLWPSSCMMATDGDEALSIVVGAKRLTETAVLRVATRPDQLRQGHAAHVLDSLRRKLAVLGPPRLVAEVPRHRPAAKALFSSLGWTRDRFFLDLRLDLAFTATVRAERVAATELIAEAMPGPDSAWIRQRETLHQAAGDLLGLRAAGGSWVLAFLEPAPTVVAQAIRDDEDLPALVAALAARGLPVRFAGLAPSEGLVAHLRRLGFEVEAEVDRWTIEARAD